MQVLTTTPYLLSPQVPMGLPGLECRMPLLLSHSRRPQTFLELTQVVAVACTNPAKLYGIYPRKVSAAECLGVPLGASECL